VRIRSLRNRAKAETASTNLIYMSSRVIRPVPFHTLTFKAGTDPNIAQVQVQNKLQLAGPLPAPDRSAAGIAVVKSTRTFFVDL